MTIAANDRQTFQGVLMNLRRKWRFLVLAAAGSVVSALSVGLPVAHAAAPAPQATGTGALVSVGSPPNMHPQNAQNEPALAVDPVNPNILAAGANDLVDMQPCSKQAAITAAACSFPLGTFNLGVGLLGVYFSFDSGHSWIQPTYHGLTAAGCDPTAEPCTPQPGPIHTVPNYFENGLRSRSDPGVAFGPVPKNGTFSYANGSRMYLATLATNLTDTKIQQGGINSTEAITVSHIDNLTPARVADQSNWSRPFFVPAHVASSAGLDKEQVWADNAATSPFFGRVYVCYSDFHSFSRGNNFALFPSVAVSTDGGQTWTAHHVAPPTTSTPQGVHQGCTVRTDSHGNVFAFFTHFPSMTSNLNGAQTLVKSTTGGDTWGRPVDFMQMNTGCFFFDPVAGRCNMEGPAGARSDLMAMPSIDIANGAPTGTDATNEIVDVWSDGRFGVNHEVSLLSFSTDGGQTWSAPATVSLPGDRALYSAPAIAPDGSRVYVTYNAFTTPLTDSTATPRLEHGVLLSSPIGAGGAPTGFTTEFVGKSGDARGTSQGRILYNEFLGDYVYAIATRTYGAGVWTDVPNTADCPAMDTWRQASFNAGHRVFPAPWPLGDCPANFGNNDISSATTAP
jgi:hypothetical protein